MAINFSNYESDVAPCPVNKTSDGRKTTTTEGKFYTMQLKQEEMVPDVPAAVPRPETIIVETLDSSLQYCLGLIDDKLMKGYITRLDKLEAVPADFTGVKNMSFFKIDELVYEDEEFSAEKLSTVYHALSNKPCTVALMIRSDGCRNSLYLGVRPDSPEFSLATMGDLLKQTFLGQFPGSRTSDYFDSTKEMQQDFHSISSVSCVSDYRQGKQQCDNKQFIQSIEKFLIGMMGKKYTAVVLAQNVMSDDLKHIRRQYENIYSQISPFAEIQLNFSVSESSSSANGVSENISIAATNGTNSVYSTSESYAKGTSDGTNQSINVSDSSGFTTTVTKGKTQSTAEGTFHAESTSVSTTEGSSTGVNASSTLKDNINFGINMGKSNSKSTTQGVTDSVSRTITDSISHSVSKGKSTTHTKGSSEGTTHSDSFTQTIGLSNNWGESNSFTNTFGLARSDTLTDTLGTGKGVVLNAKDCQLQSVLARLDKQIQRMDECESIGMWECSAYFLGDNKSISESAANMYLSLISGAGSGVERSAVNTWSDADSESDELRRNFQIVKQYTEHFSVPIFTYSDEAGTRVSPSSLVSTSELAIQMGLPKKSVRGLPVSEHSVFGQEIISDSEITESLQLGKVLHLNAVTNEPVILDKQSLAMHTLVTGSTGSGKSNTVYGLIGRALEKGIPFLVIEPAKGEYKNVFGRYKDVRVLGTNPSVSELLKINPFSFPDKIHVLEHIDRLVEIFNVCWSMSAAMPAILKDSVIQAYKHCGWDLDNSVNKYSNDLFPCFSDLLHEIQCVVRSSAYSEEVKGNYIGSLETRVRSLTNGLNGSIFAPDETDSKTLFDSCVIADLSRVGSQETKSLIMGVLVMKLNEYRMSNSNGMNAPLKHLTVLEEAHNLLKRTSVGQDPEVPNTMGKSVEMLSNSIAEMRTYGEGFIIADQSPNALDSSAIRNTNTKIIMRLPDETDRRLAGKSAALTDKQLEELAKLPCGTAAVYQNNWHEPVLCLIDKYNVAYAPYVYIRSQMETPDSKIRAKLVRLLLCGNAQAIKESDIVSIKESLAGSHYPTEDKIIFYSLIGELKEYGALQVWDKKHYSTLAKLVMKAIGCTLSDVREEVYSANALNEAYKNITGLVMSHTDLAGSILGMKISLCLIECLRQADKISEEICEGLYKFAMRR